MINGSLRFISEKAAKWLCIGTWCVALEYVLWPTEEPGSLGGAAWSLIGNVLLATLVVAMIVAIAGPLWRRVRDRLNSRRRWTGLATLWAASVLFWMWMSSEISLLPAQSAGSSGVILVPLATPFGFLPSALFVIPGTVLQGYLSPLLALFVVLGFLWSGAVLEGFLRRAGPPGDREVRRAGRGVQVAHSFSWMPGLGFSMYCCSTPPLLSALLLLGAPSGWVGAYGNLAPVMNGVWMLCSVLAVLASVQLATRFRGPSLPEVSGARSRSLA